MKRLIVAAAALALLTVGCGKSEKDATTKASNETKTEQVAEVKAEVTEDHSACDKETKATCDSLKAAGEKCDSTKCDSLKTACEKKAEEVKDTTAKEEKHTAACKH